MSSASFSRLETVNALASPSLNVDTADRRAHKGRQRILCLVLLIAGLQGISRWTWFVPSCPNSEAVAVCGNGQNGQISAAATTSFTPCAAGTLDAVELMGIAQVGLTINAPPKESCLLYGCSRTQCLRTDRACPDASGPASYSCVDGEYIVDIQPFPMAVCISLVVLAVVLFVTRRPYDLSNARLAGVLIVSFGLYHLAGTVGVYRSCPWDSMTASSCESIPDGVSPPHQVVSLSECFFNDMWGFSPFASNAPRNPFGQCQLYGCSASECLKTTAACSSSSASSGAALAQPGATQHECVAQQATTDAKPPVVFAEAFIIVLGAALVWLTYRVSIGWSRALGLVLFVWGLHCAGNVIAFSKSCNWDAMTPSKCGTGQNGETRNEEIVTVESCAVNPLLLQPFTPFAVNVMPLSTCKSYGCGTDQCLEARTPCVNGVHGNSTTHVCVDQESMSSTAPLSLFFHLVVAVLGIVVFFRFGQRGSVAVCGWQRQRPNMSARSHSRRGRAWHSDDFGSRGADGKDAASARMLSGTMDSRDGSFGNSSLPQS